MNKSHQSMTFILPFKPRDGRKRFSLPSEAEMPMTTIVPFTSLLGKLLFCCGVLYFLASEPVVFVAFENHLKQRAPFVGYEASGLFPLKAVMEEWSLDARWWRAQRS